eukprot:TRINITY_DN15145_c0_g1_i1.p1 TRINITY_DN15145_c0_g1~~TRINITY_DN15145_c0_g1_i1.p1  ORF type:complete len:672 (-),score=174.63 TRINITY_DN15145_c0_g1_i1:46-2061(-)
MDGQDGELRLPRATRVKNKAPAPIQITAEQLLREASDRSSAPYRPVRERRPEGPELEMYRLNKRRQFEDKLRLNRLQTNVWFKYAAFEEAQNDFRRVRSVYERALDVNFQNFSLWLRYAEFEMRNKNINHARNIWDRAVTLLPRVDQLWFKYAFFEEKLGNIAGARAVFERWMEWQPQEQPWLTYIKFEQRYQEFERTRTLYERYVDCHQTVKAFLRYAKFEAKMGQTDRARAVYERAIEELGERGNDERIFVAFARFEERIRQVDRARAIYKYALDHISKEEATELYKRFIAFEKQHGDRNAIEDVIIGKRRFQYEEEIKANSHNYDVWFDYIRLEETNGDTQRVRDLYERAISNLPPVQEKRYWRRYIYLWINYALYEELETQDIDRARAVYRECIRILPHKVFSFAKIWILYANFEVRQKRLDDARKVFGMGIGLAPREKIFIAYVNLEASLAEIGRCRTILEKFLEWAPSHVDAFLQYIDLEKALDEEERARALYKLAIEQPILDRPEKLWKSFIDFEIERDQPDNAKALYEQLLERTKHVKVWISYAKFVAETQEDVAAARDVYRRGDAALKDAQQKEERMLLIESWRDFERQHGDEASVKAVQEKMPKRVKKKRTTESGAIEEYYDFIFPDEQATAPAQKLLDMAQRWKRQKQEEEAAAVTAMQE